MLGTHKLAVQTGQSAAYAEVTLEVEEDSEQLQVIFDDSTLPHYRLAAEFAIRNQLEWFRHRATKYTVKIKEIRYNVVDTSLLAVAYATAHALLKALGEPADHGPTFDKDTFRYCFSSWNQPESV